MGEVLVLVDHVEGEIKKSTFELLTAARALGEPSAVVVGAPGTAAKLVDGLREYGAEKVYVAETDADGVPVPAGGRARRAGRAGRPGGGADRHVGGRQGGRGPARRAHGQCLAQRRRGRVDGGSGVTHSVFGGAWTVRATARTAHPVITVRPGSVEATPAAAAGAEEAVDVPAAARGARSSPGSR